jgi:hypothetical protein
MNEEITIKKWKDLPMKERIGYLTSFVLIGSGILIAFLSFFLNAYNIATGVLIYIAQCFVIGGGLIGANVYFKSKWVEFNTQAIKYVDKRIKEYEQQRLED